MKIITTAINKGGTGKTTTAAALAQAAASSGKKILAIDLDPQSNFSIVLGADPSQPGSYDLLHGADPAELIQTTAQAIDVITGAPDLATEQTAAGSAMRLTKAIKPIKKNYDFVIIDTPPQMGELTFNALQASTGLIIPLETDISSLQGLYQITGIVNQIKESSNPDLEILGTILTRYDTRPKINRFIKDKIQEAGEAIGAPFIMAIRTGIAIREAQALQQSLYEYAPRSNPAADYMELFNIINSK